MLEELFKNGLPSSSLDEKVIMRMHGSSHAIHKGHHILMGSADGIQGARHEKHASNTWMHNEIVQMNWFFGTISFPFL